MIKIETKSRYEVISELEERKRDLIEERDGLEQEAKIKERQIKKMEQDKSDAIIRFDRAMADLKEELDDYRKHMNERKQTIKELITSVDESLKRMNTMMK